MSSVRSATEIPSTALAVETRRFVEKVEPTYLVNHSLRTYFLGRVVGEQRGLLPGEDYDDELLFIGCVLHDIGLTEFGNGTQRFEVDGADLAVRFLRDQGVAQERLDVVWDAIALHTAIGIAQRKQPEVALLQAGTVLDMLGGRIDAMPAPDVVDTMLSEFPRLDITRAASEDMIRQVAARPVKGPPMSFAGELMRQRDPHAGLPTWDQLVASSEWADR